MYTFNSTVFIIFTGNNIWLCTANTGKSTSTTVWWRTKVIMFLDSKISVSWTICVREFLVLEGKFTLSMNEKRWKHVCERHWEADNMQSPQLTNGHRLLPSKKSQNMKLNVEFKFEVQGKLQRGDREERPWPE